MSTYMWFRIVTLLIIQSRQQERQQQQRQRQHYGDASLYNSAGEYAHTCTHLPQCYRADPDKDGSRSATGTCHGKPFCHKWAAHQLYGIEPILGTMRQCPASTFFTCLVCECDCVCAVASALLCIFSLEALAYPFATLETGDNNSLTWKSWNGHAEANIMIIYYGKASKHRSIIWQ
ncbi:hypothetical protein I7I53_05707 [Histoplasma capsulatum var. duboisii H88]|uniref:Uncharacterized protein n=1 Tax=Ajellomyces capsulatus (strain H88) TaxID=544711 RepID=A0A8A1LT67_AJEC8|nr:hypothetical protein I7I53_05707 [Histoplasma capsulatum var. duboisii H88]